ncbi:scabin-related ADP-ribosyltransferase [Streptomyces sp. cg35]|uniref:scabin-related ADP-ribosyltransferase n=1 Tax=Streptomyces sp. cg35 TaxID=3421650 RepID=UPI003D17E2E3
MSMQASPEVNAMLFILTGERLLQADEDMAYASRQPYGRLGKRVRDLSGLIEKSVRDISTAMPDDVGREYVRAMSMLIDDGGKNYLREFGDQLDKIADGRVKASMDILESKWQVIAEVIRLLIEIAFYLALSYFTGGASLTQIALAKARSRLLILTTLSHLLERMHLLPSLTEALEEAFTTFVVRLGMMLAGPDGRRPDGFDWGQILKDGAFGALAGGFASIFHGAAKNILNGYDNNFLKGGPDLNFKNGGPDLPKNGPDLPKHGPDTPKGNGPDAPKPGPDTPKGNGPDAPRPDPDAPKGDGPDLPGDGPGKGAITGHHVVKETSDFIASGGAESLAEIIAGGLFYGDWSTSWSTFVGAGVSDRVGSALNTGAINTGNGLRDFVADLRNQPPPTVSGTGPVGGASTDGNDHGTDNAPHGEDSRDSATSTGPQDGLGERDFNDQYAAPPTSTRTVPETESDLWRDVHTGSPEARNAALEAIGESRGTPPPGVDEIGVRDALHHQLSDVPEIRVVSGGTGPAAAADIADVRHALQGLGPQVTVTGPPGAATVDSSPTAGPTQVSSSPDGITQAPSSTTTGPGTAPAPPSSAPTPSANRAPETTQNTAPPAADAAHDETAQAQAHQPSGSVTSQDTGTVEPEPNSTPEPTLLESSNTVAPLAEPGRPLTVMVSDTPLSLDAPASATRLLDASGADHAVVLGPPPAASPAPGTPAPPREAAVLSRDVPSGPVQVRPLPTSPSAQGPSEFPGSDVLRPVTQALGATSSAAPVDSDAPAARPVTESSATVGTDRTLTPPPTTSTPSPTTESTADPQPATTSTTSTTAPLAAEPQPSTSTNTGADAHSDSDSDTDTDTADVATDLHLESGSVAPTTTPPPVTPVATTPVGTPQHQGPVTPKPPQPAPQSRLVVTRPIDAPGAPSPATTPSVTTLDGHTLPLDQIRKRVVGDPARAQQGGAVRTLTVSQSTVEDGTSRATDRERLLDQDTYRTARATLPSHGGTPPRQNGAPRAVFTGPPRPLPGSGTEHGADYFVAHGTPRTVTLGTGDTGRPSVVVSGVQLGNVLRAWNKDGATERPLVLYSCETGRRPEVAGLPVAQHVANRTGRRVYAPTSEAGTAKDRDGEVRAVLTEGPEGPGAWRLFTPEPSGRDLDALARTSGLHTGPGPADPFARARTLQHVRTLRGVLGHDAEQRPDAAELLSGLAYVDGLRWRSPDPEGRFTDGRMTPGLLQRMVSHGDTAASPTAPTPDAHIAFLRDAARLASSGDTDTTLARLLPSPAPQLPPDTLVSPEDVQGLQYAPAARITWQLSDAPLPLSELALSPEDTATLLARRPDLAAASSPPTVRTDVTPLDDLEVLGLKAGGFRGAVQVEGRSFRTVPTAADGDCFFRAVLTGARAQGVAPQWAQTDVAGLRTLLHTGLNGSELADALTESAPDPVRTVVDDLRERFLAGSHLDDAATRRAAESAWDALSQAALAGDVTTWQRLLRESSYPGLLDVAPTPEAARRTGSGGLLAATAARTGLWSSPFGDLVPTALARAADLDLRVVRNGAVTALHPGGRGGTLYVAYNGRDHYEGLAAPAPTTTPAPAPPPVKTVPEPARTQDLFQDWLDSMRSLDEALRDEPSAAARLRSAPVLPDTTLPSAADDVVADAQRRAEETEQRLSDALDGATKSSGSTQGAPSVVDDGVSTADGADPAEPATGEKVPLETQLERHRPTRLLTGADAPPPGPPPSTVTFDDGSRLPTALIGPDADDARGPSGGLMSGLGRATLRDPDQVADEIVRGLPQQVRDRFDDAELRRLLAEEPGAFTGPRGAGFVARERSEVGYEITVEAVPYHRWERFADADGATTKVDTLRRGQASTGVSRSVATLRRAAGAISLGPPLEWLLKLGASIGRSRRTDYSTGSQAFSQSEWRAMDGSHLHVDDVYYRVRVDRVTPGPDTTPRGPGAMSPGWHRQPVHEGGFAVRGGLTWRLPDSLTEPYTGPTRAPETITFRDGAAPRVADTTALHLRDSPEDLALAMSGARPGSSAHRTLVSFLRPGSLLGLFPRLSGQVVGPELTRGRSQHPLGHLIVERAVSHKGTRVTEATKVELRNVDQITQQNERTHTRETRFGAQITAGPNHMYQGAAADVRIQGGPMARLDLGAGRAHYIGGSAARKITGRVKGTPVALYQVEKTLYVRRPGEPPSAARPFRVVTLDWIPTSEAQRLAEWDTRTPGQTGPQPAPEPAAPPYLAADDPSHLGHTRAEGFVPEQLPPADGEPGPVAAPDPMATFADAALDALHQSYPALFPAPWERRHPRLARLLYGDGRTRVALHNDRQVRDALSRPTLAQSLEVLTTTGVPVSLTEDGPVRRGHHTLTLTARLTDRRYETSLSERSLRNSVSATQQLGQARQASSTQSVGAELGISPRDKAKAPETGWARRIGGLTLGVRHAWGRQHATRTTVAVTNDHLTAQTAAHLFSYRVELNATFDGHRRPRGWARLATVGALGAGVFVSTVRPRPLFDGGAAPVGRVELAAPAAQSSPRYAPSTGTPSQDTEHPSPEGNLTPEEAERLVDGTGPSSDPDATDVTWTRDLLSRPFAVLSAEGAQQRQQVAERTAAQATGSSWHVTTPGTPVRGALRRAMENLSVAGHIGQILGPFGQRVTGLHAAGPLQTHHIKATLHARLRRLRVTGDPNQGSFEVTTGADHRTTGSSGTSSRTTVGLQGSLSPQHVDGHHPVHGSYAAGGQLAWGKGASASETLGSGRNTILTYTGRTYPVSADLTETVAVRDRWSAALGLAGTRAATSLRSWAGRVSPWAADHLVPRPRPAAARTHEVRDAVLLHLPMQDAIETGLAPDGLSTSTPHHLAGGYRVPPFLRNRRFATHPTGLLDASHHARELLPRLEALGVPSHDREQVLQMLSPDFLRGQLHELSTDGVTLPVQYRAWARPGDLPTGGSPGQLRFRLRPVTTTVDRLRTGYEVEDYRPTARDTSGGTSQDRGGDVTLAASESPAVARDGGLLGIGPTLQGSAAEQQQSGRSRAVGTSASPNIATTQSHAELVTGYELEVTATDSTGDALFDTVSGNVGTLRELLPVSLLTPDGDTGEVADVPEPPRTVRLLTALQAKADAVSDWRAEDSDLVLDDKVGTGFLPVDILGAPTVHDALTLATARADGTGDRDLGTTLDGDALTEAVRKARRTPLTALGTAPAQAQQEAAGQTGLTAGLREALSAQGLGLPQLSSARLLGQSHTADVRMYAKLSRRGARLLAVENKPRMEGAVRGKTSDTLDAGSATTTEAAVGTSPMAGTSQAGVITPGASATVGGATDGTQLKGSVESGLGTHLKVATPRSMLFALPVRWLSVVEADHHLTDSRALQALGRARRGPRAAEAGTTALVWVREDIATDLGLLDDTTFPETTRQAWDDLTQAQADLTEADKRYYDARAQARTAWLDMTDEERASAAGGFETQPGASSDSASPAVRSWRAAREEAATWEGHAAAAAEQAHRLHAAAFRVTHPTPGTTTPDSTAAEGEEATKSAYQEPDWRSAAPATYTVTDGAGSGPRTLTSPDGSTVWDVHDVPKDGASFFHALLAAAHHHGVQAPLGDGTPTGTDPIEEARTRLVDALGQRDNEDLLSALAPEANEAFTAEELAAADVELDGPHQAEFSARGALPQPRWLSEGERLRLASEALSRPFGTDDRAWNHGAADLLPALAARVLRTPVTVVTADGHHQRFVPTGSDADASGPELTLFVADDHFQVALPAGSPPPPPAVPRPAASTDTTPVDTPAQVSGHRTHTTPPWSPPTAGEASGRPGFRLAATGVLTAPDGSTYHQGTPSDRGNGFFGALSQAMRHASRLPGTSRSDAARLRVRAGSSPAQLMRLHGLPGRAADRDALFRPPPVRPRRGAPAPSDFERARVLREHLATAAWGQEADQAMARWAARASGARVTLVEENGTAHTFGSGDTQLVLRRRGGDFVPLLQHTPPSASAREDIPSPDPASTPPGEEGAFELHTLSGARAGSVPPQHPQITQFPRDDEGDTLASGEFPVLHEGQGWTVRGQVDADPHSTELAAENASLGLRGRFSAEGPGAGRVTDDTGRIHDEGPAWDWFHRTRGLIASSRFRTAPGDTPGSLVPLSWEDAPTADQPPVPPRRTAAQASPALDDLPHPMRWRTDDAPLYRFTAEDPDEVFLNGLRAPGTGLAHVLDHAYNGASDSSGYVSTTRDTDYARRSLDLAPAASAALDARHRWRYDLDLPGGIDVNGTLGLASPFPDQREVLFPGGIAPRFVRGAQRLLDGRPFGPYVPNPGHRPLPPRAPRDHRPRHVVRSGFDVRRFTYAGEPVTDLTVRVAVRGGNAGEASRVLDQLHAGVAEFFNAPAHRLPGGDRLHVTVERVDPSDDAHLTVTLAGRDRPMDQHTWWRDASPVELAHELAHQLGLRDEYRDRGSAHRAQVPGSLLGAYDQAPPDSALAAAGLRPRHLALLSAVIGDVPLHTRTDPDGGPLSDPSGDEDDLRSARAAAPPAARRAIWVDPVALPRPSSPATTDVAPRAPQQADGNPASAPHLADLEQHFAAQVAGLLGHSPVDVPALLGVLHRRTSLLGTPPQASFDDAFRQHAGTSLAEVLDNAVEQGRLRPQDHELVLTGLGLVTQFPATSQPLNPVAVAPGAHPRHLPQAIGFAQRLSELLREDADAPGALALLAGLDRDLPRIWAVSDAFHELTGTDLRDALNWYAHDDAARVQDVLGDPYTAPATPQQVAQWYDRMAQLRYHHYRYDTLPLPHNHPEDGCYLRAHLMALQLQRWGASVRKITVAGPRLGVVSSNAHNATTHNPLAITWRYHIAPAVLATRPDGTTGYLVIDPALEQGPLSDEQWLTTIGAPPAADDLRLIDMPVDAAQGSLLLDQILNPDQWDGDQPRGRNVVLITDAHALWFPWPNSIQPSDLKSADDQFRGYVDELARHSWEALARAVIRDIENGLRAREHARATPENAAAHASWAEERWTWMEREGRLLTHPALAERVRALLPPGHAAHAFVLLDPAASLFDPVPGFQQLAWTMPVLPDLDAFLPADLTLPQLDLDDVNFADFLNFPQSD